MSDWCILRTKGRLTLPLATALERAGFDVWAPVKMVDCRISRANTKREKQEVPAPLLPTCVFARSRHVPQLLNLAADPTKAQPDFSVFRQPSVPGIPLIADRTLDGLRDYERAERINTARRRPQRKFESETPVSISEGAAAGLSGIVKSGAGKYTEVEVQGWKWKIATYMLSTAEDMAA